MVNHSTEELFANKRVVVFAVPGAFTPTRSEAHLPGYVVLADEIKAANVDAIACVSVTMHLSCRLGVKPRTQTRS